MIEIKANPFRGKFSVKELYEIYQDTRESKWPALLGQKPDGFDDLPDIRPDGKKGNKIRTVKEDLLFPIRCLMVELIGVDTIKMLEYEQMSPEQKINKALTYASPGSKIEDIQALSEHLARNLDW